MPELPEVETIVRDLRNKVLNRAFVGVWTDWEKMFRKPSSFKQFKKQILGRRIKDVKRRGKLILIELSGNKTLLAHQKLTGHFLTGKWRFDKACPSRLAPLGSRGRRGCWRSKIKGPLEDKVNAYIHLLFTLDNGLMLALSDLRKFAFIELWETDELEKSEGLKGLGPEPLDKNFTFEKFKKALLAARGKIKQVLMNQKVIAGIGNIYSDEILWQAKVNPLKEINPVRGSKAGKKKYVQQTSNGVKGLRNKEIKRIYKAMREILSEAIKAGGSTLPSNVEEFRGIEGERGRYQLRLNVYRRAGEKCSRCGTVIKRIKIGGRSCHYCPKCQR